MPRSINQRDSTGAIACDAKVFHGGDHSLRIENGNPFGTVELTQCVDVEPSQRYRIAMWVKGDHVGNTGGAVVHIVGSSNNDKKDSNLWSGAIKGLDWYKSPSPNNGTFDWAQFVFTLDTLSGTRALKLSLELRNASGTLWYDDIEVTALERIVPVESY